MKKPIVIAISAVSGGGKTTVINEFKKRLPLSKTIYFEIMILRNILKTSFNGYKVVGIIMHGI